MLPKQSNPSKAEVEALARSYGMVYQEEVLTFSEPSGIQKVKPSPNPQESSTTPSRVSIPYGSSSDRIARILKEHGIIEDGQAFNARVKERGVSGKLDAGDYILSPALTIDEIIDELLVKEGRQKSD